MKKREGKVAYSMNWLATTRQHAIRMWRKALKRTDPEEVKAWEWIIMDLEDEMAERGSQLRRVKGSAQTRIVIALVVIMLLIVATIVSSCQTYKGVTGDMGWILTKTSENVQIEKE